MGVKENLRIMYDKIYKKFGDQFGFQMNDVTFTKIANYLHSPKDSSSLAVTRILFGLAMLFDIPDERGGATMDRRWGDPKICHFPLLPFLTAMPMPYMALVYTALWFGALGIMLGYKYRISSAMFTISYWYLLLIEKSYWNNHSYLFGLIGLLLTCTQANCYWSLDAYLNPTFSKETVPYWNYFVLKYQFFILYFMAGLKKGTAEWLTGYSVQRLSEHWVFAPFKLILTVPQIDYLIVHWFVFMFDLTVVFWMMWDRTRHVAMVFCALFNLMNSRLFRIGMFPWVCLATMPLFYPFDWPKITINFLKQCYTNIKKKICNYWDLSPKQHCHCIQNVNDDKGTEEDVIGATNDTIIHEKIVDKQNIMIVEDITLKKDDEMTDEEIDTFKNQKIAANCDISFLNKEMVIDSQDPNKLTEENINETVKEMGFRKKFTTYMIFVYVLTQAFLPYSHFITKGYNNWTNGLYGYSWDMMVHTWDTHSVVVKIVDNRFNKESYIDPYIYTPNDRWTRHGDMVYQYAQCLKNNLINEARSRQWNVFTSDISVYIDVWCSMNGRFTQRLFDPKVDLLKAEWSPFERIPYLMPLLDEADDWRSTLDDVKEQVQSWNNYSDVVFIADFPGYDQDKYIPYEITNVTLTVLQGPIAFEPEVTGLPSGQSYQLATGDRIRVDSGIFHRVLNIGTKPAYYMYTFINATELNSDKIIKQIQPKLPVFKELFTRLANVFTFASLVVKSIFRMNFYVAKCY